MVIMKSKLPEKVISEPNLTFYSLRNSTFLMLSTFIYISWPTMKSWHTYTRAHVPLTKLMTWRINPTAASYADLCSTTPAWVPTKLQISVPHPPVIDWIPFPSMRDKLIHYH